MEAPSSDSARSKPSISKHDSEDDCPKLNFRGSLGYPDGEETVNARLLLMSLLEVPEGFGGIFYMLINDCSSIVII